MSDDTFAPGRPSAIETIILGGLTVGFLDMLDAFVFFGWYLDVGIQRVFQSVAAGILGREAAIAGGWSTFALGLSLHYVVATYIATVFFIARRYLPFLWRHPVVSGMAYGVLCHFFMQCVVIPLSAIGGTPSFGLRTTLNGIIGHALLVGLPLALIARWSARRNSSAAM